MGSKENERTSKALEQAEALRENVQKEVQEVYTSNAAVFAWVVSYCLASTSMTLLNKGAIKALPFPYWLCVMQNMATLIILFLVWLSVEKGHKIFGFRVQITLRMLKYWMPAVILFCLMLVSSLSALHLTSVPTVLVFRSLTPVVTLVFESRLLGASASLNVWLSLVVILLGAICYVITDFQASVAGYLWLSTNLISAALYHVYVKWIINMIGVSTMDMVLFNNALSVPLLLTFAFVVDKPRQILPALGDLDVLAWLWVVFSLVVAGVISFTGFGLQATVSATSATVVNHFNKVASFIAAYLIFKDNFNAWMVVGIIVTLLGTVWYGRERLAERGSRSQGKPPDEETPLHKDRPAKG